MPQKQAAGRLDISQTPEWEALQEHVKEIEKTHLRDLMQEHDRVESLIVEHNGLYCDFSRQRRGPCARRDLRTPAARWVDARSPNVDRSAPSLRAG